MWVGSSLFQGTCKLLWHRFGAAVSSPVCEETIVCQTRLLPEVTGQSGNVRNVLASAKAVGMETCTPWDGLGMSLSTGCTQLPSRDV